MEIVPVRALPVEFVAAKNEMVPSAIPLALVRTSHGESLVAVQAQPCSAVTVAEPDPPAEPNEALGCPENDAAVQAAPDCVSVNGLPATKIV